MKTKSIIIIMNLYGNDKAMVVANFSDENVKNAIGKLMETKPENLQCVATSISEGIYRITKTPHLKHELKPIVGLETKDALVQLSYAHLHD